MRTVLNIRSVAGLATMFGHVVRSSHMLAHTLVTQVCIGYTSMSSVFVGGARRLELSPCNTSMYAHCHHAQLGLAPCKNTPAPASACQSSLSGIDICWRYAKADSSDVAGHAAFHGSSPHSM